MTAAQAKARSSNRHYEAAWNDSWHFRSCFHEHKTLIEAAECAMPHGAGWYVVCVESGNTRELTEEENEVVNKFRFSNEVTKPIQNENAKPIKIGKRRLRRILKGKR